MSLHTDANEVAVGTVIQMVARELQGVSQLLGAMHAPVEPETWRLLARDGAWLNALQNIDRIEQILNAVTQFMYSAADQCHPRWRIDTAAPASEITLAQLRDRLHPARVEAQALAPASGECELFGRPWLSDTARSSGPGPSLIRRSR